MRGLGYAMAIGLGLMACSLGAQQRPESQALGTAALSATSSPQANPASLRGQELEALFSSAEEAEGEVAAGLLQSALDLLESEPPSGILIAQLERIVDLAAERDAEEPCDRALDRLGQVLVNAEHVDPLQTWRLEKRLGERLQRRGANEDALVHYDRAMTLIESVRIEDWDARVAVVEHSRAQCLFHLGRYDLAIATARGVVESGDLAGAADRVMAGTDLYTMLGEGRGDLDAARAVLEETVKAAIQDLPPRSAARVHARSLLYWFKRDVGDLDGAIELSREALAALEPVDLSEDPIALTVAWGLASALKRANRLPETLAIARRIAAELDGDGGTESEGRVNANMTVAIVLFEMDRASEALPVARRALLDARRSLSEDHPYQLKAGRTVLWIQKGLAGAAPSVQELLRLTTEPVDIEDTAALTIWVRAQQNLAVALIGEKRWEEALGALNSVLALARPDMLVGKPMVALQINRSMALKALGRTEEAYGDLLAFHEAQQSDDVDVIRQLGYLANRLGDQAEALDWAEKALLGALTTRLDDPVGLLELAAGVLWEGRGIVAEQAASSAFHRFEMLFRAALASSWNLSTSEQIRRTEDLLDEVGLLLSLHGDGAFDVLRAFSIIEQMRALETSPLIAERWQDAGLSNAVAQAAGALQYAVLESIAGEKTGDQAVLDALVGREASERGLRSALRARGVDWGSADTEVALDPGVGLATFWFFNAVRREGARTVPAGRRLVRFVVASRGVVKMEILKDVERVEALIEAWRESILPGSSGASLATEWLTTDEIGRELRALILDPALEALGGVARLHVVWHGPLREIPWDALPHESGLVGDLVEIVPHLSLASLGGKPGPEPAGTLLAVGAVDYQPQLRPGEEGTLLVTEGQARHALPMGPFPPLVHSGAEVERIASLWTRFTKTDCERLTSSAVTRQALVEAMPRAQYLHLATHAFVVDIGRNSMDSVTGSPPADLDSIGRLAMIARLVPRALCGLALSGAEGSLDDHGNLTGLITGEEIAALDLSRCEVAVLAGCGTALGLPYGEAGIASLQTSFLSAGTGAVVASLWPVGDLASYRFMVRFYGALFSETTEGVATSVEKALWRAKRSLFDERVPIVDWAGWVVTR